MKSQCGLLHFSRVKFHEVMLMNHHGNKEGKYSNAFFLPNLNVTSTKDEFVRCLYRRTSTILQ